MSAPEFTFTTAAPMTGWYQDRFGAKTYVIEDEKVDRETWLAYVAAHPDEFSDPKWTE